MVRQINHLLQEIQNITKNEIFQDQLNEKIKLPPIGKIRRKEELKEKFKLNLLSDRILADNIAYAIQYVDLLSYLYEMTELGGKKSLSVGAIFRKYAVIAVASVIEAYLSGIIEWIAERCGICSLLKSCGFINKLLHYKSSQKIAKRLSRIREKEYILNYKSSLDFISSIIELPSESYDDLNKPRKIRNHIHIQYLDSERKVRVRDYSIGKTMYEISLFSKAFQILESLPQRFTEIEKDLESECQNNN